MFAGLRLQSAKALGASRGTHVVGGLNMLFEGVLPPDVPSHFNKAFYVFYAGCSTRHRYLISYIGNIE